MEAKRGCGEDEAAIYLRRENVINKCEKPFGSCPHSSLIFISFNFIIFSLVLSFRAEVSFCLNNFN